MTFHILVVAILMNGQPSPDLFYPMMAFDNPTRCEAAADKYRIFAPAENDDGVVFQFGVACIEKDTDYGLPVERSASWER